MYVDPARFFCVCTWVAEEGGGVDGLRLGGRMGPCPSWFPSKNKQRSGASRTLQTGRSQADELLKTRQTLTKIGGVPPFPRLVFPARLRGSLTQRKK